MATSILDGTIEEATLKRSFWKMRVFDPVIVRRTDGNLENLGKRIVQGDLADSIVPGAAGRFYLYSTIDHQGIHGIRDGRGSDFFAFPMNNEIASLACIALGSLMLALHYLVGIRFSGWAPLLLVIGIAGAIIYGLARVEARKQFDGDEPIQP